MGLLGGIKILITLASIVGVAGIAFFAKDLLGAGVEDYSFEGINSVDASGFNARISLEISNPSKIDVSADRVDYRAVLRDTGETVASGTLEGLSLPAGEITEITLNPRINWVPGANLLIQYASEDEVWLDIELKVKIFEFLPVSSITIPVDIKKTFGRSGFPVDSLEEESGSGILSDVV